MVKDLLIDLAEDVPNYADPDRALARYRRTRRRRRLASSVAAVLIIGLAASLAPWRLRSPDTFTPADPPPVSFGEYPPTLLEQEHRQPLPDGPVGPALLLYQRVYESPPMLQTILVLRDGRQFDTDAGTSGVASLSPNGRWLVDQMGSDARSAFAVRDLVGGGIREIDPELTAADGWEPMTWSPDSRFLLMWNSFRYVRIELRTGRTVPFQTAGDTAVLAVFPGGDLLVGPTDAVPPITLARVHPEGGREPSAITIRANSAPVPGSSGGWELLRPQEHLTNDGTQPALINPRGDRVAMRVSGTSQGENPSVVVVDLRTGEVLDRRNVSHGPAQMEGEGPADQLGTYTAEGVVLVRLIEPRGIYLAVDFDRPGASLPPQSMRLPVFMVGLLVPGAHTWYDWK